MKRRNQGFSLAEMLTAVAILAVLCAIAIPGIIAIRNNLEMRRLDDTAREIYMAAQNRLTALESAGTVEKLGAAVSGDNGDRWLFSNDAGMRMLLPVGSVEGVTAENQYAIYYNELSGDVLEVYYSEKTALQSDGAAMQSAYGEGQSAKRKEDKIGFYKGEGSGRANIVDLPMPTVVIANDEKLTVKVDASGVDEMLLVMIRDADGNEAVLYNGTVGGFGVSTGGTNEIVLDSLSEKFCDLYEGLVPGSDITVTAKLSKAPSETTTYRSAVGSDTDNSLFASVDDTMAKVANLRHLQNLSSTFSGVTDTVTEAEQTQAIDCAKYDGAAYTFQSIYNSVLTSFDGQGNEILNLNVTGAGLFASFSGSTLSNVMLNNPSVSGSGSVGALAGTVTNTAVTGCQVYGTSSSVSGGTVGGLIGMATGSTVKGCSASVVNVSGTTVGGLIGSMMGGSVEHSYADSGDRGGTEGAWRNGLSGMTAGGLAGSMGSGASVLNSYAVGYIEDADTAGGIVGSGSGTVSGSYAAITFADGIGTKNAIAPFASTGCKSWSGSGAAAADTDTTLEELSMGSGWTSRRGTVPYTQGTAEAPVCSGHYPYPMFADLTHYGDWPVEVGGDIDIEDEEGNGIDCIFIPYGSERTVQLFSVAHPENEVQVKASKNLKLSVLSGAEYGTRMRVEAKNPSGSNNVDPGLYSFDVEADGYTKRIIVVVYKVKIILAPTGGVSRSSGVYNTVDSSPKPATGALTLNAASAANKAGSFSATVEPYFGKKSLEVQYDSEMQSSKFDPSITIEDLLEDINTATPYVHENGGRAIGEEVGTKATPGPNAALNVTGQYSGRARVRAAWAKDPSAYAECIIEMQGNRVMIHTAKAVGTDNEGGMGTVEGPEYPYKLSLYPAAGEEVDLSLTAQTFGSTAGVTNQVYTWEIFEKGGTVPIATKTGSTLDAYRLPCTSGEAEYRIKLTYSYQKNGSTQRSADEMFVTVLYKAAHTHGNYGQVKLFEKQYDQKQWTLLESGKPLLVEQINGTGVYAGCDTARIAAYIDGAVNTQVKWYVSASGDLGKAPTEPEWVDIASVQGSQPVRLEEATRANVRWEQTNDDKIEGNETGGAVVITGIDANDFGTQPFVFLLKAVAVDSISSGERDPASWTVEVHVMPQLRISPQSSAKAGWMGSCSTEFTANRADSRSGWSYVWHLEPTYENEVLASDNSIKFYFGSDTSIANTRTVVAPGYSADWWDFVSGSVLNLPIRRAEVWVEYGPYCEGRKATAQFEARGAISGGKVALTINQDGEFTDTANKSAYEGGYFLLERGREEPLSFSWAGNRSRGAQCTAQPNADYAEMSFVTAKIDGSTKSSLSENYGDAGTAEYTLLGKEVTDNTPQKITWAVSTHDYEVVRIFPLKWDYVDHHEKDFSCAVYVYGLDMRLDNTSGALVDEITLKSVDETATLCADPSFPSDLLSSSTIEWELTAGEDIVELTDHGNGTVTVTAKKYSSDNFYATVLCTYTANCINGRPYRCVRSIPVRVEPATELTFDVEACTADADGEAIAKLFGEDVTEKSWLNQQESDGSWLLVEEPEFKANVTYLKVIPKCENIQLTVDELDDYYLNIYGDASCLDLQKKRLSESYEADSTDPDAIYLRIEAKSGTAGDTKKSPKLMIDIGTAAGDELANETQLSYYKAPSLLILRNGTDVTNKSLKIDSGDNTMSFGGFSAQLFPQLLDRNGLPMNTIKWSLGHPDGYDETSYVALSKTETVTNSTADTVSVVRNSSLKPDFRVFLEAKASSASEKNTLSTAGYALAFLPDN